MDYIVKAVYWDVNGMFKGGTSWVVDDVDIFYKAKDKEGQVKEVIDDFKQIEEDEEISRVDIKVYEISGDVTDKFI